MRTDGILELIEHDGSRTAYDDLMLAVKMIERNPKLLDRYTSLETTLSNIKRIAGELKQKGDKL